MRVTALAAVLALLGVLVDGAVAAAHPLPHGDVPRVVDLEPAPGSVRPPGQVTIRALAAANRPVTAHRVVVDGQEVPSSAGSGGHATITAQVSLAAGTHRIQVFATTDAGTGGREWDLTVSPLHVERIAGGDRVATAVEVSRSLYPDGGAAAAVLARADAFPDALAGVPLAHAEGGPLLLTQRSRLTEGTAEELRRVLPQGATVFLLGGEGALAPQVSADLAALGLQVERLAGANRYETAVEIAKRLPDADHAMLASGEDFADALAVSSPAAVNGYPVLLSRPTSLPAEVRGYIEAQQLRGVHVIGGAAAIGSTVREEVRGLVTGMSQTSGATRFETAAAVGERFLPDAGVVTLANGSDFPDALAGGVFAAAHGAPMLLSSSARLFNPQLVQVATTGAGRAFAFGGQAALGTSALFDLLRAAVDAGGPLVQATAPSGTVGELDGITVTFDRAVEPASSRMYATVNGHEVAGTVASGSSARVLRFVPSDVPELQPGRTYPAQVVVSAGDGTATRHLEYAFTYRRGHATLRPGDRGAEVSDLQRRLRDARYWVGSLDGQYGTLTQQAVMALQKVHRLPRTGVYDPATRAVLEAGPALPRPRTGPGDGLYYEVDLIRQVLMRVVNGQVTWIFNTSTGHGQTYWFQGVQYRANTTTGNHRITRQIDGPRQAERGLLWRPKYYDDSRGIAIHGSASVPAEPASAGCIRVTNPAMDFIWSLDPSPSGRVWVYPENYYG